MITVASIRNGGFSLVEMMISAALAATGILLVGTVVQYATVSGNRLQTLKNNSDYSNLLSEIINGPNCDYALQTPSGNPVAFNGATVDVYVLAANPLLGTSQIFLQPGAVGGGLNITSVQLSEQQATYGRMQKKPIFNTLMGEMHPSTQNLTNFRSMLPGTPNIPDVQKAFGVTAGMQVLGLGIPNDDTNTNGLFGAQVVAVSPTTIQISKFPYRDNQYEILQIGGLYDVYTAQVTVTVQDTKNNMKLSKYSAPILVAVGEKSGTIDHCYRRDLSLLCGAMGGTVDSNGACSHTMYDQMTSLNGSSYSCNPNTVTPGHDCGPMPGCSPQYVITGVTSTGGFLCQCVEDCPL